MVHRQPKCSTQLHTLALNIFSVCVANQIRLEPEWLPREESLQAVESSIMMTEDWTQ